jgi:hypothetical protein
MRNPRLGGRGQGTICFILSTAPALSKQESADMHTNAKGPAVLDRPNHSHRERDDAYCDVILERGNWRVIRCKDGIQWIVQKRAPGSSRSDSWRGVSFHLHRDSLVREWRKVSGWDGLELMVLPQVFKRQAE